MTAQKTAAEVVNDLISRRDKILRVQRVAQMLDVKPHTVLIWLRKGKMNGRKVGSMWQILATEVVRYIQEGPLPEDPTRNLSEEREQDSAEG